MAAEKENGTANKGENNKGGNRDMITLRSSDGHEFLVSRHYASISKVIEQFMLDNPGANTMSLDAATLAAVTPVDNQYVCDIKGAPLANVVTYMNQHRGIPGLPPEKPLRGKTMKEVCPHKWDATWIDGLWDISKQSVYDVILAANALKINCLLHLGSAKVALIIKGKPTDQMKALLAP